MSSKVIQEQRKSLTFLRSWIHSKVAEEELLSLDIKGDDGRKNHENQKIGKCRLAKSRSCRHNCSQVLSYSTRNSSFHSASLRRTKHLTIWRATRIIATLNLTHRFWTFRSSQTRLSIHRAIPRTHPHVRSRLVWRRTFQALQFASSVFSSGSAPLTGKE